MKKSGLLIVIRLLTVGRWQPEEDDGPFLCRDAHKPLSEAPSLGITRVKLTGVCYPLDIGSKTSVRNIHDWLRQLANPK